MKHTKRLFIIFAIAAFLLLIPLAAMQFTNEVNWTLSDFLLAAVLFLITGLAFEFGIRKIKKSGLRIFLSAVLLAALVIIWAELAVGILGSPLGGQ